MVHSDLTAAAEIVDGIADDRVMRRDLALQCLANITASCAPGETIEAGPLSALLSLLIED